MPDRHQKTRVTAVGKDGEFFTRGFILAGFKNFARRAQRIRTGGLECVLVPADKAFYEKLPNASRYFGCAGIGPDNGVYLILGHALKPDGHLLGYFVLLKVGFPGRDPGGIVVEQDERLWPGSEFPEQARTTARGQSETVWVHHHVQGAAVIDDATRCIAPVTILLPRAEDIIEEVVNQSQILK